MLNLFKAVIANNRAGGWRRLMRAAILDVGSHIFFQHMGSDAQQVASALDGGSPLAELLKNLPRRHMVVKSGSEHFQEVCTSRVDDSRTGYADLYERTQEPWARKRNEVEDAIALRHASLIHTTDDVLQGWQ